MSKTVVLFRSATPRRRPQKSYLHYRGSRCPLLSKLHACPYIGSHIKGRTYMAARHPAWGRNQLIFGAKHTGAKPKTSIKVISSQQSMANYETALDNLFPLPLTVKGVIGVPTATLTMM
ncbi:hypothetical protein PM082_006907 [Marasmius tenuissimus]|nr:hypothetical protein PM082_006907 [Marasmius tenuissimus]